MSVVYGFKGFGLSFKGFGSGPLITNYLIKNHQKIFFLIRVI